MSVNNHFSIVEDQFLSSVKDGKAYRAWDEQLIAVAGTYYYHLQTGDSETLFYSYYITSDSAPLKTRIYVNPTGVTGGTALTSYPLNLGKPNTSQVVITGGVSITTPGIQTDQFSLYGTDKATASPQESEDRLLRIVPPNSSVLFSVETTDNNSEFLVKLRWMES